MKNITFASLFFSFLLLFVNQIQAISKADVYLYLTQVHPICKEDINLRIILEIKCTPEEKDDETTRTEEELSTWMETLFEKEDAPSKLLAISAIHSGFHTGTITQQCQNYKENPQIFQSFTQDYTTPLTGTTSTTATNTSSTIQEVSKEEAYLYLTEIHPTCKEQFLLKMILEQNSTLEEKNDTTPLSKEALLTWIKSIFDKEDILPTEEILPSMILAISAIDSSFDTETIKEQCLFYKQKQLRTQAQGLPRNPPSQTTQSGQRSNKRKRLEIIEID